MLQIFDTWAGVLPPREFQRWSVEPTARIVEGVRKQVPDAKIIGFPRGAGALLPDYVEATGVDAVSIDWTAEPALIRERVQSKVAVQGNLDPLVLIAGGAALDRAVDDVLANYAKGRLIFNLGHGIQPETPIAHVEQMVKRVRELCKRLSHRPAALDDLGRALGEQLQADRAAEFARAIGRPRARGLDEAAAGLIQHRGRQRHLRAVDVRKSRDRRIAVAVEHPQHLALGVGAGDARPDRRSLTGCARVSKSRAAHSTATMPCPTAGSMSRNRKFVGDAARRARRARARSAP